jgi:hypothetical protein
MSSPPLYPVLGIDGRNVVAVEHPMIIKNIEKGIKTFGQGRPFNRVSHRTRDIKPPAPAGILPYITASRLG